MSCSLNSVSCIIISHFTYLPIWYLNFPKMAFLLKKKKSKKKKDKLEEIFTRVSLVSLIKIYPALMMRTFRFC